jgi:tetratricopeptide (TPR) repeat protein
MSKAKPVQVLLSQSLIGLVMGMIPVTALCQLPPLPTSDDGLATGQAAVSAEHWAIADKLLHEYLLQHQNSAPAHYLLGLTLLNENRPKESLAEYTLAAHLARPTAVAFREVALDYVLLNAYPDADRWSTRSVKENSNDSESWYVLGRIKYTENHFSESRDAFVKALALAPRLVKAENNLGLAYEGLQQQADAIHAYQQAIAWQKDDAHPSEQPYINLGILLNDSNRPEEALAPLLQAVAIAPHDTRAHGALGELYRRQEQFAKAQVQFELAVAEEPNDASLHFQLAQVYRHEGMNAKAKTELDRVAALDGTHSSAASKD